MAARAKSRRAILRLTQAPQRRLAQALRLIQATPARRLAVPPEPMREAWPEPPQVA